MATVLTFGVLLAGCAADPLGAERARILRGWTADPSLALAVAPAAEAPPAPVLIERQSRRLENAAVMGLAGALTPWISVVASATFDLQLALFLTPIFAVCGAIYGAIDAPPRETLLSLEQFPDAAPLIARTLREREWETALITRLAGIGEEATSRRWRIVALGGAAQPAPAPPPAAGGVTIALQRFGFVRDRGEQAFALFLEGKTYIAACAGPRGVLWRSWDHESPAHQQAEWLADEGTLIERELADAIEGLAREIAGQFGAALHRPSDGYAPALTPLLPVPARP